MSAETRWSYVLKVVAVGAIVVVVVETAVVVIVVTVAARISWC